MLLAQIVVELQSVQAMMSASVPLAVVRTQVFEERQRGQCGSTKPHGNA
jgi:hypothetical protein